MLPNVLPKVGHHKLHPAFVKRQQSRLLHGYSPMDFTHWNLRRRAVAFAQDWPVDSTSAEDRSVLRCLKESHDRSDVLDARLGQVQLNWSCRHRCSKERNRPRQRGNNNAKTTLAKETLFGGSVQRRSLRQ